MDQLFGVPMRSLAFALLAGMVALGGWVAWVGWRAPILFWLGARNVPRRPARAALIAFGLMLSTTVIGGAFGVGDAMTWTVRSVVTQSLGAVDEVVVLDPPRAARQDRLTALTEPGLAAIAATGPAFFAQADATRLTASAGGAGAVATIAPAIVDNVAVIDPATQQTRAAMLLLAVAPDDAPRLGGSVDLASLAPDDVVINRAAAAELGAGGGSELRVLLDPGATIGADGWTARVAAIEPADRLTGTRPAIVMPLARYQALLGREGSVNTALVVNRGGVESVNNTDLALQALRVQLVNRDAAARLYAILRGADAQRGLALAASALDGAERQRVTALREAAAQPELTDRFISLVSDPTVRNGLLILARDSLSGTARLEANRALHSLTPLTVLPIKQRGVEEAEEYGAVVTTVFLVLGVFSLAAAVLLVFLIFSLLAADRGTELATMRALGMRDRQVMGIFLVEGLIYDLCGAALGALGGLFAAWATIGSIAGALREFGFIVERRVEPRSIFIAFALGLLLTFAAMLFSAWRVSRAAIVAATRGETQDERRGWLLAVGIGLGLLAVAVWRLWPAPAPAFGPRHPLVAPTTYTLAILAVLAAANSLAPGARWRGLINALGTLAGLALLGVWLLTLTRLPTPRGNVQADALTIAVAGLTLLGATVWTSSRAIGPALKLLDGALTAFGRLRAVVRPAGGYLAWQRWRTSMAVLMFGMVVFTMVAALTLIHVLLTAYNRGEAPVAGFEIRATMQQGGSVRDLRAELATAAGIAPGAFSAVGSVATSDAKVVQFGAARSGWRDAPLAAADDAFLGAARVALTRRAPGYASDSAMWQALRDQPGLAVVSASLVRTGGALELPTGGGFAPVTLWARLDSAGSSPVKLRVVGVIDPSSELAAGVYTSRATAMMLGPLPDPETYLLALAPGVRVDDAVTGLRASFAERGITFSDLGDTLRVSQSVRLLLTRLVQSFMGLGLIAGVAALGMLGAQAVIERRRELGTLRALGFTAWETRASLIIESAAVAALGVGTGTVLGLWLARSLATLLAADRPEIVFSVPWEQIALTTGGAWLGSLLAIVLAAWQAGRVAPAEALRAVA